MGWRIDRSMISTEKQQQRHHHEEANVSLRRHTTHQASGRISLKIKFHAIKKNISFFSIWQLSAASDTPQLSVVNLNADVMTAGKRIGFRLSMRNGPTSTQPGKEKLVAGDRQPKKKNNKQGFCWW